MAEFTQVGKHCSIPHCNQQDFLPFECDCCAAVFCLQHRSYDSHECPKSAGRNMTAIICPLCKMTIRLTDADDPNREWDIHSRTSCRGEAPTRKKKRCAAPNCKETLTLTNSQNCSSCHHQVCLRHRYPDSHSCVSLRRKDRESAFAVPLTCQFQKSKAIKKPIYCNENSVRGSANRRKPSNNPLRPTGAITEQCPNCSQSFETVDDLIQHSETVHANMNGIAGTDQGETCPLCYHHFDSVVSLINHVQTVHHKPVRSRKGGKCLVT